MKIEPKFQFKSLAHRARRGLNTTTTSILNGIGSLLGYLTRLNQRAVTSLNATPSSDLNGSCYTVQQDIELPNIIEIGVPDKLGVTNSLRSTFRLQARSTIWTDGHKIVYGGYTLIAPHVKSLLNLSEFFRPLNKAFVNPLAAYRSTKIPGRPLSTYPFPESLTIACLDVEALKDVRNGYWVPRDELIPEGRKKSVDAPDAIKGSDPMKPWRPKSDAVNPLRASGPERPRTCAACETALGNHWEFRTCETCKGIVASGQGQCVQHPSCSCAEKPCLHCGDAKCGGSRGWICFNPKKLPRVWSWEGPCDQDPKPEYAYTSMERKEFSTTEEYEALVKEVGGLESLWRTDPDVSHIFNVTKPFLQLSGGGIVPL